MSAESHTIIKPLCQWCHGWPLNRCKWLIPASIWHPSVTNGRPLVTGYYIISLPFCLTGLFSRDHSTLRQVPLRSPKEDDWCEILQARCPSCHQNNDVKALKRYVSCEAKNHHFYFLNNSVKPCSMLIFFGIQIPEWISHPLDNHVICRLEHREPA